MYIPPPFAERDLKRLHDLIEQYSFGLLISADGGEPQASHLPMLLDRRDGPHGALYGHLARANSHWQQASGKPILAIFSGPQAYISAGWYEEEKVVPTWNYLAVHVRGVLELIEDAPTLGQIVRDYVEFYERGLPRPWNMDGLEEFYERLLSQIVGFRLRIETIEGKWKLSQNHTRQRRERVIAALRQQPDDNSQAIAALMAQSLQKPPE